LGVRTVTRGKGVEEYSGELYCLPTKKEILLRGSFSFGKKEKGEKEGEKNKRIKKKRMRYSPMTIGKKKRRASYRGDRFPILKKGEGVRWKSYT